MRLIRPSRRKTNRSQTCLPLRADVRSAPALRPVRCFAPPVGNNRGPNRSQSLDQVILIRCRISPAPRSVHRLGKTAFACPPHCLRHPGANPHITQTRQTPPSPHAGKTNKSVSCFSLFTMSKTIKVQTNVKPHAQPTPGGPMPIRPVGRCPYDPWADAHTTRGSMPARQRRAKPMNYAKGVQKPKSRRDTPKDAKRVLVGRGGLEPPTSRLSGVRSNQLSYRPGSRWPGSR
jgi:hypothetical protein